MLGVVTGLRAEARLARPLGLVAVGGGMPDGARRAAERLVARGATSLISFGVAGGLDPALAAGGLVIPARVISAGAAWRVSAGLAAALGGPTATSLYSGGEAVARAAAKRALHESSGAVAVDLESAAVAAVAQEHGLRFAVLRAVCDPAGSDLPRAALVATDEGGGVAPGRLLRALLRRPWEIGALIRLAGDMRAARASLARQVAGLESLAADPRF